MSAGESNELAPGQSGAVITVGPVLAFQVTIDTMVEG